MHVFNIIILKNDLPLKICIYIGSIISPEVYFYIHGSINSRSDILVLIKVQNRLYYIYCFNLLAAINKMFKGKNFYKAVNFS